MQGTLTTSSPPLVIGTEVAKTDTSFFEVPGSSSQYGPSSGSYSTFRRLFYPQWRCSQGRRRVFPVLLLLSILLLFFLTSKLNGLIGVKRSGGFAIGLLWFLEPGFFSAGFLGSDFLGLHLRKSIVGWGPLGQRASESWAMVLDYRPTLASAMTAFWTISLKLVDARSCCSILTLIEDLGLSWK